jgi:deoxyribonuclease V
MLAVLEVLSTKPDLLLIDGQGLAHPRRFGLACHVGVLADIPAIGVAKSQLVGTYEEPGLERGSWSPLLDRGETVGSVVRTRRAVRPVFVSTGHRVSLQTAVKLVLELAPRHRLPEPIRLADRLSRMHP